LIRRRQSLGQGTRRDCENPFGLIAAENLDQRGTLVASEREREREEEREKRREEGNKIK
jgi:hypothetical protein